MEALVLNAVSELPEPLRIGVQKQWQDFIASIGPAAFDGDNARRCLRTLPKVWACSEFVAHSCQRHPSLLGDLIESADLLALYPSGLLAERVHRLAAAAHDEAELKRCLRSLRRREFVRIAWRDLAGWSALSEVMETLSEFAEASIDAALAWLYAAAVARHGTPRAEGNRLPVPMVVLGLGKLGGRELNFSSDVDLIFAYGGSGHTSGERSLSNQEFFVQLGRRLINVLSDSTEDGFVFRVDMRLRPNGDSGELALSFEAMEQYYQIHGREWERYALIKARVVGGDRAGGEALLARLRPFVYRRYLDYGAVNAIREMKVMINRELLRKGMRGNIKQGPGGIREIEFIGQAFQLIRGGRERELQERSILKVLARLAERGHLQSDTAAELNAAYCFLRTAENRLQMMADRQTHQLPEGALEQLRLATAMDCGDWSSFVSSLRQHMNRVQRHFDQVFAVPRHDEARAPEQLLSLWLGTIDDVRARAMLLDHGFAEAGEVLAMLRALREGPLYTELSSEGRTRTDRLMPLLLAAAAGTDDPGTTLVRLLKVVEAIGRRSAYLVLLVENPVALAQLVRLSAASSWIANWISQHPVLLDELLHPAGLYAPASRTVLEQELRERLASTPDEDLEAQMDTLREFRHGHLLRVAAADIGPGLAPEEVGRHLADLAEVVLEHSLYLAKHDLTHRHGEPVCQTNGRRWVPGFAIIAYGKLGSLELGYASDLDMIFLYEACPVTGETTGPRRISNEMFFARLGQRLIHILTTRTSTGLLYEVDMRLRPSGQSGPLVTSMTAFRRYQLEHAWTWEHQALVRARPVAGEATLCAGFAAVRREVLCLKRAEARLRAEVKDMRAKMYAAQTGHTDTQFDLKHERGGIVDIEFMVQYWVLLWAARYPELADHTDNISILGVLADTGLLAHERAQLLIDAYRYYLSTEHRLKLTEQKPLVETAELGVFPDKVAEIWCDVFERPSAAS